MQRLPIDDVMEAVIAAVRAAGAAVLVAPPGAGKSTRVPPAILRAGVLASASDDVVVLQPRRVAARAVAERIASENGWRVGEEVGYHVRFERRVGPRTRLRVLTEGVLTRQLLDDPLLEGVGCVVLDEFHERSLHTDVAAALLCEVRDARPELKVVVMSATLDAEPVSRYFGGCPIVRSEGRTHAVSVTYSPVGAVTLESAVASAVDEALSGDADGDVLVFLPGSQEIRRSIEAVEPLVRSFDAEALPLHGSLPFDRQVAATRPGERRRVICATNVAETSLTIQGVTCVIDSGLVRSAFYDPRRGLDRLEVGWISRASATQRAGRAGRVRPGRCIRLFSEKAYHALSPHDVPEVRRVDLCQTVLTLHGWGRHDPRGFGWYESPPVERVTLAQRLLTLLGALDGDGRLTALGRRMLAVPAHPRLSRMLLAASDAGHAEIGATLAALLSERDVLQRTGGERGGANRSDHGSDLLLRADALQWAERERFGEAVRSRGIDPAAARRAATVRDDLLASMRADRRDRDETPDRALDPLLLPVLAYPDRVCRRRSHDPSLAVMAGGGGVRLAASSVVTRGDLFVALDARHGDRAAGPGSRQEATVTIASPVERQWLTDHLPHMLRREQAAVYDEQRGRVVGRVRDWFLDLLLDERETGRVGPEAAATVLREALVGRAAEVVRASEAAAGLLQRAAFSVAVAPGRFAELDPAALTVERLVAQACAGSESIDGVREKLPAMIDAALGYAGRRDVDALAPESVSVPSGSRVRLDWSTAQAEPQVRGPALAVRLQELFGLAETPRVAAGRVPVVLHLLGPNFRPVQVTTDLASFWRNTYPQVRKDLRVRYPRHAWPDDPVSATPQAKGGRRR
jgi:ATP-dependent helicase HrpB